MGMDASRPTCTSCCEDHISLPPAALSNCTLSRTFVPSGKGSKCGRAVKRNVSPGEKTSESRVKSTRTWSPGARVTNMRFPCPSRSLLTNSSTTSDSGISTVNGRSGASAAVNWIVQRAESGASASTSKPSYARELRVANNQSLPADRAAWFQIHRGGFVGLDAQRLRFGKPAFAKGDGSLPLPFAPAAPSNAQPKFFGQEIKRREGEQCQKGRPRAVFPPTGRRWSGCRKNKCSQRFRTSVSEHRNLLVLFDVND